jgi:catechol 2,3-dioxygenase-like lactoylglutathione lyase family enzyme
MQSFHARSVFFVRDAARSLEFYTNTLGFTLEWKHEHEGRPHVFQVGLLGFSLILNQAEPATTDRCGHGRVFIGLELDQADAFKRHVDGLGIHTTSTHWGRPTIVIHDLDQNELFFWPPEADDAKSEGGDTGGKPMSLSVDRGADRGHL